jgi:hypothetical protein
MEFVVVDGVTLADRIERQVRLAEPEAVRLVTRWRGRWTWRTPAVLAAAAD